MAWGFELIDVTARRDGRTVLRGTNVGARTGLITALVGPPESGKTAVVRLLAGLDRPDVGAVLVGGHDIGRAKPKARQRHQQRMSVVLQGAESGLFGQSTVRENMEFPMRAAGRVPRRHVAAVAAAELERFDLGHRADAYPDALAPSERRCLALARAIAMRAPYVLVDGLEDDLPPDTLATVCRMVREAGAARAGTWLVTTRDAAVAELVADEAVDVRTSAVAAIAQPV